jgi:CyaY protein
MAAGAATPGGGRKATMDETAFLRAADRALAAIGEALDLALRTSDEAVDWNLAEGILEIECGDGSKIIVNRHAANREIWVAARSGGFHYRPAEGGWEDTRGGAPLAEALAKLLREQARLAVDLSPLRAL